MYQNYNNNKNNDLESKTEYKSFESEPFYIDIQENTTDCGEIKENKWSIDCTKKRFGSGTGVLPAIWNNKSGYVAKQIKGIEQKNAAQREGDLLKSINNNWIYKPCGIAIYRSFFRRNTNSYLFSNHYGIDSFHMVENNNGKLSEGQIRVINIQTMMALKCLIVKGISITDLHPGNILFEPLT